MLKNINAPSIKPKPQRTCVTCRQVKAKQEMVRLVRLASGDIEIDISGRKNGRGAYLCRLRKCWEAAFESGRLEHSLSTAINQGRREQLVKDAAPLFSGS